MTFLSFNADNKLFIRSPEKWELYNILENEFVINTTKNYITYYRFINKTFHVTIQGCSNINCQSKVNANLRILCLDGNSTGSYFIDNSLNVSLPFVYGYPLFEVDISSSFVGPNLMFEVELLGTSDNDMSIVTPVIRNPNGNTIELENTIEDCTRNVFNRFEDPKTGELMVSFYCIQDYSITQHIFYTTNMSETEMKVMNYSNSEFIAFLKSESSYYNADNEEVLMILSKEKDIDGNDYMFHIFNIGQYFIVWTRKFSINTDGHELRPVNPAINLKDSPYIVLVGVDNKILYFMTDDPGSVNSFTYFSEKEVVNIFICSESFVYLTHKDDNKVTVLKIAQFPSKTLNDFNITVNHH